MNFDEDLCKIIAEASRCRVRRIRFPNGAEIFFHEPRETQQVVSPVPPPAIEEVLARKEATPNPLENQATAKETALKLKEDHAFFMEELRIAYPSLYEDMVGGELDDRDTND